MDYIGNNTANTKINGDGTVSEKGTVDLFGWVGASSTWTGAAQYGISNSTTSNSTDTYGNVGSEALKSDWGALMGDGNTWQTLSADEWKYLLNSRGDYSYVKATVNGVNGVILLPDGWNTETYSLDKYNTTDAGFDANTITKDSDWEKMESNGAVFLPAAGYRIGSDVYDASHSGRYWFLSAPDSRLSKMLYLDWSNITPNGADYRYNGFSVRLVRPLQE